MDIRSLRFCVAVATTVETTPVFPNPGASPTSQRPAAAAAARMSRAGLTLGALGLGAAVLVLSRLFATWRVSPNAASHQVSVLGQRLTYPTANAAAIVVLALALLGLAVMLLAIGGAVRELAGDSRLRRRLQALVVGRHDDALVLGDAYPQAFCAGLFRPRVYISTGAIAALDGEALGAVLAHERHHRDRRDPLRFAAARVLASSLFCVPGIRPLARRQLEAAELGADESATRSGPHGRKALARAMLAFLETDAGGVDPGRLDYLFGETRSWRFPVVLCAAAICVISLLIVVSLLAGRVAAGSATLAPPFISGQPCVLMLAMIAAAILLIPAYLARVR
jgi:uncharacterized integral membrane protein